MLNKDKAAKKIFLKNGGLLRTSQAIRLGIHPVKLYKLREQGVINQISRGVYQLAEAEISNPEMVAVARKIPRAVVCLISALAFYDLTTIIPRAEIKQTTARGIFLATATISGLEISASASWYTPLLI